MFSEVDNTIFPDSCEVIQVASQQFVYPIFKCGRSSLQISMESRGWTYVPEQKISDIKDPITVFLRDPRQRFVSGVNTYLQHLQAEGNGLDQHTVLYFVNRYLFLNRHYAPQFFWLLNLARFAGVDCQVSLKPITDINLLTDQHSHAMVEPMTDQLRQHIESFDWSKLELYLLLDQCLLEHMGQTLTIRHLINHVQTHKPELYKLIFRPTLDLVDVLPKT